MTDAQKEQVRYLRCEGLGYGAIATRLGISRIRSRAFAAATTSPEWLPKEPVVVCRNCGRPLPQYPKRKQRKFAPRLAAAHGGSCTRSLSIKPPSIRPPCAHCGQEFQSYGNRKRKYCSHACYIAARFQKGGTHDEGTV